MSQRSLYEILNVPADAKPHAIKAAYRAEAMRHHPDRLPPDATAEQKQAQLEAFQQLQDAYDILMDRERREQYDLSGQIPKSKTQLAQEAMSFIIQAFTQTVDQMSDMLAQNPILEHQMRSPVAIIETSINQRLVQCQDTVRVARDKRKALKKIVRGLRRKDGSDASTSPVVISINEVMKTVVKAIVNAETEIGMLRVALKLNAEWDYTKPAPSPDDEFDSMVAIMRLAYGDTPTPAPIEAEPDTDGADEDGEEWPADDWPEETAFVSEPTQKWGK